MKYLFLLLLTVLTFNVDAQMTFKEAPKSSTSSSIDLNTHSETVTIAGKEFKGGTSSSGSIWIIRVSSKKGSKNYGKPYKSYLGTPTKETYNGKTVWTTKKQDKWWYFTINDKGFPKRNYLEVSN